MALQTNLHLPLGAQTRGIHDRGANLLRPGACRPYGFDVALTRSMASLAIDSLGYRLQILRFRAGFLMAFRNPRIRVVTEHAFVVDHAGRTLIFRPVVA